MKTPACGAQEEQSDDGRAALRDAMVKPLGSTLASHPAATFGQPKRSQSAVPFEGEDDTSQDYVEPGKLVSSFV
jgi:hypothetical protein